MRDSDELLNDLYTMVQDAKAFPFGRDMCILDRDKVMVLIDEIKDTLPDEIKQARSVVARRNELIDQAKKESDNVKQRALDESKRRVEDSEILKDAQTRANEILHNAKLKADESAKTSQAAAQNTIKAAQDKAENIVREATQKMRQGQQAAISYLDGSLAKSEEIINNTLNELRSTRKDFKNFLAGQQSPRS